MTLTQESTNGVANSSNLLTASAPKKKSKETSKKKQSEYEKVSYSGVELYVHKDTNECYQTQKAYSQLSGVSSSTVASRLKNTKRVKASLYNESIGRAISTYLIPIKTVIEMLTKDRPEDIEKVKRLAEEYGTLFSESTDTETGKVESPLEMTPMVSDCLLKYGSPENKAPSDLNTGESEGENSTFVNATISRNGEPVFSWFSYDPNVDIKCKEEGDFIKVEITLSKNG